jgi:4-hydroxy-tetrahydrodipicolinate synthase
MTPSPLPSIAGVFPVLPTPFDSQGQPDTKSLQRLVRYVLLCRVDGITYPGVASEFAQLSEEERSTLTLLVLREVSGRVPVVAGVTSSDLGTTKRLARKFADAGAAALMVAAPPDRPDAVAQITYFSELAAHVPGVPLMLQNVPPPVGAGLEPDLLLDILRAVPAIQYIKEETLPSGQRLSAVLTQAPPTLLGVFGGAGGRYITDELRRGACGTMPAIELAEVHVTLFAAHRRGDSHAVRSLFTRMLPVLNIQAVFRWALTKQVLLQRGLITHNTQRIDGPRLDEMDRTELNTFLDDLNDLMLKPADIAQISLEDDIHGAA